MKNTGFLQGFWKGTSAAPKAMESLYFFCAFS